MGLFRFRVDKHVMGHAFRAVEIELDNFISAGGLGRDDFDNQIRRVSQGGGYPRRAWQVHRSPVGVLGELFDLVLPLAALA